MAKFRFWFGIMADVSDILIRDFMQLNPVNVDFRGWEMHPFRQRSVLSLNRNSNTIVF